MEELVNCIVQFGTAIFSFIDCHAATISAIATAVTMLAIAVQCRISNKARKDNLFKIRLDKYEEVLSFCLSLQSLFYEIFIASEKARLKEEKRRYDIYQSVKGSRMFLAQVEYLFGDKIVAYIKDRYELGELSQLGKINRDSNKFELDTKLESMFVPFLNLK